MRTEQKQANHRRRMRDPEYAAAYREKRKWYHREYKYGISREVFDQMVLDQGGRCLICGRKRVLVVDHDHHSGEVRGLLCPRCNQGLGMFEDNPKLLRKAIRYLMRGA